MGYTSVAPSRFRLFGVLFMEHLTLSDIQETQSLYDRGLYLQAYEASKGLGPLNTWRGLDGRVLAGRLAGNLGSSRLAGTLQWLGWREHPGHAKTAQYRAYMHLSRWGAYSTLRWMDRVGQLDFDEAGNRAEWLAFYARCCALLRDRAQADAVIEQARSIESDCRWLDVEHAGVLEHTDRYDAALDVIQGCLERDPDYRPALQCAAHLLHLTGKDDQAIDLLEAASARLESGALHCQLASLLRERQAFDAAREQYERGVAKMPLLDPKTGDAWLTRIRSDLASACGEPDTSLKLLESIPDRHKNYFYKQVEQALRDRSPDACRKRLDVAFIRQHYRTCAPATLAMMAKYWGRPAEHMEIADAICFDGTPYHAERTWAEEAGYIVAEFTVDQDSAIALIDRGVPFTFSTNEPDSGHLQAVIGYDTTRRVLLLRDPFFPSVGEILMDSLEERYGAYGPRGMVLVPPDKAHLLEGLTLTDRNLWDRSHRVRSALIDHDRDTALKALDEMRRADPDATLTLNAELSLADYDKNGDTRSRIIETLIERYPKCPALVPQRLGSLSEHGLRQKRLDLLREACERDEASPALILRYAGELTEDARQHGWAQWHLRRLIRRNNLNAEAYHQLGSLWWKFERREEATELYRIASCIEDLRERHAMAFFRAKRFFRQERDVLSILAERFERLSDKDSGPARTLYEAHRLMSRADLGFEVLEHAVERRPNDGWLMLFTAEELSAYGRHERAAELLEQAKARSRPLDWRRTAAILAADAGQIEQAREHWHAILTAAPMNIRAHQSWCAMTRRLEGADQAVAHWRDIVKRFPHHWDLQCELYHELGDVDPDEALEVLRGLIKQVPGDAWAWRELGFKCAERPGELDQAKQAAERARELDPNSVFTYNLLGRIAEMSGDTDAAREAYRVAVRLDPDASYPIERLIEQYHTRDERRDATRYILDQLAEQVTFGDGILTYQGVANRALPPEEVLSDLRRARDQRPDLWQAWASLIDQLLLCNKSDEAVKIAAQATERFPLTPNLWYRRAETHRVRLEQDKRVQFMEEALRMAPGYNAAVAELADAYESQGDAERTERVLLQALDRNPRSARFHTRLADLYWRSGRSDDALDHIDQAVRLEPGVTSCWDRYAAWSARCGKPETAAATARELTKTHRTDPGVWLNLAEVLSKPQDLEERLDALDCSIELNPRDSAAYDLKAQILVDAHRYDEARAACNPPTYNGRPPFELRGRACWIDYQQGKAEAAIQGLWALIEDEPTYIWGLKLLIDWCGDAGDFDGQMRATDLLIQADPHDHVALGYRGDARLQQAADDKTSPAEKERLRKLAKKDLDRAAHLSPGYTFATDRLFNLHLEDGELDLAQSTFEHAGDYLDAESRLSMRIALACKRGEKQAAMDLLRELCVLPTDQDWLFGYAYDHAQELKLAEPIFTEMCRDENANPLVAQQLVRAMGTGRSWKHAIHALNKLKDWPEGWDQAAGYLFYAFGEHGDQENHRSLVDALYRKNRKRVLGSNHAWRGAIYALAAMDLTAHTIEVFDGWEQRDDIEPYMLGNLASAYLTLGRFEEAETIFRTALDMPPDHSYPWYMVDYSHLLALRGEAQAAQELLDQVVTDHLNSALRQVFHLANALCQAHLAPTPAERDAGVKAQLEEARSCLPGYKKDMGARKAYRRTVLAIGKLGGPMGRLKSYAHLLIN